MSDLMTTEMTSTNVGLGPTERKTESLGIATWESEKDNSLPLYVTVERLNCYSFEVN